MLAQQAAMGPLAGAFLRFYSAAAEGSHFPAYLCASKRLMGIATVAILGVAMALALTFSVAGQTRWIALLATAFLFSLLSGYNTAMDAMQNAARQRSIVALHQGANQWLRFSLALVLIAWLGASSSVAMLGFALASFAILASQILFFRRGIVQLHPDSEPPDDQSVIRWKAQMSHYAWPIAFWGVFTWGQLSADRWALQVCRSPREVGLYAALYQLGYSPMVLLSNFIVQFSSPVLFSRAGDGTDKGRMTHSHRLHALLMTVITLIGFFMSRYSRCSWLPSTN
jgi:O-antigen/teichoic acid export membrane protein